MERNAKIGIAVLVGAAALLVAGAASAADDVLPDDLPPPPDDEPPPVEVDPVDPGDPLPPPPAICNFSGCGPLFDGSHNTPTYYALRLQQLGYPINPAAPGWSILSPSSKNVVRTFQRDYNEVRPTIPNNAGPELDEDGYVGNRTIFAMNRAHQLVTERIQAWSVIVSLS